MLSREMLQMLKRDKGRWEGLSASAKPVPTRPNPQIAIRDIGEGEPICNNLDACAGDGFECRLFDANNQISIFDIKTRSITNG